MKVFLVFITGIVLGLVLSIWVPMPVTPNQIREERRLEITQLENDLNKQLETLSERFGNEVERLFPLELQEVEGKLQLTTPTPPSSLTHFLSRIQNLTIDSLPAPDEIDQLRQEMSLATNRLQPLQRQSFALQIELADWSLNALDFLSSSATEEEMLVSLILVQSLLDTTPVDAPPTLIDLVSEQKDFLVSRATQQIVAEANAGKTGDLGLLRSTVMIADWMNQQGLLEDTMLAGKLGVRLETEEWTNRSNQTTRDVYPSDEEFDMARYAMAEEGSTIMQSAVLQRISLPSDFVDALHELSQELAAKQRRLIEKQHAEYQIWAIRQIQAANQMIGKEGSENLDKWLKAAKLNPEDSDLELVHYLNGDAVHFEKVILKAVQEKREKAQQDKSGEAFAGEDHPDDDPLETISSEVVGYLLEKTSVIAIVDALDQTIGWKHQSEMAKALTADALLNHLIVIDESYLDRPVAALFGESFQKAWTYLEGSSYRLEVAKTGVELKKIVPGDVISQ
jgi:hypothetical protein